MRVGLRDFRRSASVFLSFQIEAARCVSWLHKKRRGISPRTIHRAAVKFEKRDQNQKRVGRFERRIDAG